MSFGIFEASFASEHEAQREQNATQDKLAAAIYDVRAKHGEFLFKAQDLEEFRDRVALCKKSAMETINGHLPPVSGVVRRIVGKNGALEKEWKQRTAAPANPYGGGSGSGSTTSPTGIMGESPSKGMPGKLNGPNANIPVSDSQGPPPAPISQRPSATPAGQGLGNTDALTKNTPAGGTGPAAGGGNYTVKPGDNLSEIAQEKGMNLADLEKDNANPLGSSGTDIGKNPNMIHPGDVLNLGPGGGSTPAPAGSPASGNGSGPAPGPAAGGTGAPAKPGGWFGGGGTGAGGAGAGGLGSSVSPSAKPGIGGPAGSPGIADNLPGAKPGPAGTGVNQPGAMNKSGQPGQNPGGGATPSMIQPEQNPGQGSGAGGLSPQGMQALEMESPGIMNAFSGAGGAPQAAPQAQAPSQPQTPPPPPGQYNPLLDSLGITNTPGDPLSHEGRRRRRADKTGPNMDIDETFDPENLPKRKDLKPKGDWDGYRNKVDQGGPSKVQRDFSNSRSTSDQFVSGGSGPNFKPGRLSRWQRELVATKHLFAGSHSLDEVGPGGSNPTNPYTGVESPYQIEPSSEDGGLQTRSWGKQGGRRRTAGDDLAKANDALTKVLNTKAEEFQQGIAPLQQALQTIQQSIQAMNPLSVAPQAGSVNVMPGQDQGAGGGAAPGVAPSPVGDPNGGMAPDPAAAAADPMAAPQQMAASRRRVGYGDWATMPGRHRPDGGQLRGTGHSGPTNLGENDHELRNHGNGDYLESEQEGPARHQAGLHTAETIYQKWQKRVQSRGVDSGLADRQNWAEGQGYKERGKGMLDKAIDGGGIMARQAPKRRAHFEDRRGRLGFSQGSAQPSRRRQASWGFDIPDPKHKVAGWKFDDYLNGYLSPEPRQFQCKCGSRFSTPTGFRRCACGKTWNSYVIGSDDSDNRTASVEKFIVREIPTRANVIVAGNNPGSLLNLVGDAVSAASTTGQEDDEFTGTGPKTPTAPPKTAGAPWGHNYMGYGDPENDPSGDMSDHPENWGDDDDEAEAHDRHARAYQSALHDLTNPGPTDEEDGADPGTATFKTKPDVNHGRQPNGQFGKGTKPRRSA